MKKRVAINQLAPLSNDLAANMRTLQQAVADNTENGSVLSIFAEDFLYGVLRNKKDLLQAATAYEENLEQLRALAIKHKTAIIPGTFPRLLEGKLYNSTVYIDKQGTVLCEYSKNNLWLSEREEYNSALKFPCVFESELGKTTILICWDLLDHSLFESAVKQGAEWIAVLSFWSVNQSKDLRLQRGSVLQKYPISDSSMLDNILRARVMEYNVGIIFCNFAGIHNYEGSSGMQKAISANRSQIIEPYYLNISRVANHKAVTLYHEVDILRARQAMSNFEIYYGRREDITNDYPFMHLT